MIDTPALSILNVTDAISNSSPVICVSANSFSDSEKINRRDSEPNDVNDAEKSVIFVLTEDASVAVLDSVKGNLITSQCYSEDKSTAISLNIIGKFLSLV